MRQKYVAVSGGRSGRTLAPSLITRGLRVQCIRGVTPRHLLSLPSLIYFGIVKLNAHWYGVLCYTLSLLFVTSFCYKWHELLKYVVCEAVKN